MNNPKKGSTAIIVSVILTLILGLAIGFYFGLKSRNSSLSSSNTQQLVNSTSKSDNNVSLSDYNNLKSELIKSKFQYYLSGFWGVRGISTTPEYNNRFYFTMKDGEKTAILYYDLSKDKDFNLEQGIFNIPSAVTWIYEESIAQTDEFRILGFDGNKLVFFQTNADDSPGPCANEWLRSNLKYINIDEKPLKDQLYTKEVYKLSAPKIKQYQAEENDCQNKL